MAGGAVRCRHPSCELTFHSEASMLDHYTHSSHGKPASAAADPPDLKDACELCPRHFKSKGGLRHHLRAFHLLSDDDLPVIPVASPLLRQDEKLNIEEVSCNDCGRTFKSMDSLHQHQWDAPHHLRVSASQKPNKGTDVRKCSQCDTKLPTAEDLEQHFVEQHPLSEVPEKEHDNGKWQLVEGQFHLAWTKATIRLYKVHRIFKVYNPGWRRRHFEDYRKELKRQMSDSTMAKDVPHDLRTQISSDGNELHRYHGTTVKCKIGQPKTDGSDEKEALSLCSDAECSLCGILQTGFMTDKCRTSCFQRYGKGIYCSESSSKASAYVKCSASAQKEKSFWGWFAMCIGSSDPSSSKKNYKVMMACRVLAGRPFHTTRNLQHLKAPPHGFHSVQGDPGEVLNYDELVLYNDHAILPAYVILYTSSDTLMWLQIKRSLCSLWDSISCFIRAAKEWCLRDFVHATKEEP